MRVATDVGGTFTDLVAMDAAGVRVTKTDTTPPNFEEGVLAAIDKAELDYSKIEDFVHGTTVVINALLSRQGSKTGLITTRGFRDVLEIARGNRPDLFNFAFKKPEPFVPRYLRMEVTERSDYRGEVVEPLALEELADIVDHFKQEGVEAIAISFLHAYVNPSHEQQAKAEIQRLWPEVSVISSHEACGEWREYERTSTAVLSAYVHPTANTYLSKIGARLDAGGLKSQPFIMRSNGGITTVEGAKADPISMVESGPASGVLGAAALGQQIGEPNLIALDIGGTTAKTALIEGGQAKITTEYKIEWDRTNPGYPIRTPVVDLVEIGNGGGSIAWIDEGGRMHVGPKSAGSQPGPAAYGRGGTQPTTTDANLLLGRINPDLFLGGSQDPDFDNARAAFKTVADQLGSTVEETARGVIRIANANMVNALKLVSLNRGHDPREFSLIAFGGGGAMHAVALAEELMVPKVIIPVNSSVFSAWGMLMCDLRRDFLKTQVTGLETENISDIVATYEQMEATAREVCVREGIPEDSIRIERFADMRYAGQEHTVKASVPAGVLDQASLAETAEAFHATHEREFTFRQDVAIELVNYHVVAFADIDKQPLPPLSKTGKVASDILTGERMVDFDMAGQHMTKTYDWQALEPDMEFTGPAVVEDTSATLVISPGKTARVDDFGNIHIDMGGAS